VERVGDVSVGQHATVIPDGSHRSLSGTVTYVSAVPRSSGSTTTSYLVIVGLDKNDADAHLKNGSTGTVSIVTESAKLALAVPTSAVTTTNSNHTVEIPDGNDTKTVSVKVGVVGAAWTEIKSGLEAGEQVVLADLSKPLPGSVTSSSNTGTGNGFPGAGGFRGGGAFPGGGGAFPGGGG
jgi:HlyD family secretion protein